MKVLYQVLSITRRSGLVFSRRAALSGRVAIKDSATAFRLAQHENPGAIASVYFKNLVFPPILALLIGAAISADASSLPEAVPLSRYQAMVERSPFAPATAAAPPPAPVVEAPSFARDFYVTGMARLGGQSFVTITSRDKQQRFSLLVGESYQGITLASVDWTSEVGKGKATLKKGSEFGVIGFDEAAMQLIPVAVATPAPVQQAGAPGQPNPNNPYAAFEGRRRGPDGGGPGRGWGGWDRRNPNGGGGGGGQAQGGQGEWRRRNRPIPSAPQ